MKPILHFSSIAIVLIALTFFSSHLCSAHAIAEAESIIDIPFGRSGKISYNKKTGRYDVLVSNKAFLRNVTSIARLLNKDYTPQSYSGSNYIKQSIKDGFGKGLKHIISFEIKGQPVLKQVFYTYPDRDFFLAELVVEGEGLRSNYMAPVVADLTLTNGEDQRSLFVPFDNDAFVRYEAKEFKGQIQNTSAEVGVVYSDESLNGIVIGSVEQQKWKSAVSSSHNKNNNKHSLIAFSGYSDKNVTRDQLPHGMLSGSSIASAKFFVGYYDDWRTGMEEYGKANRTAEPPFVFNWNKPTPVGWNSWGVLQEHINYKNTTAVADFFADSLKAFRNGKDLYIDLDSYWDNMIKGGYEGDYTELKKFADHCVSRGLKPGVYWAPFTDWGDKNNPGRRAEGSNYTFGEMWTKVNAGFHDFDGARALDPTHPGTQQRIRLVIGKLRKCGFKMIKIDFLGHAAVESSSFYDKKISTGMQAYRSGMEYLIKELNGQMLVYAAISPSLASARYVHVRRIACDAWKTIDQTEYTLNSVNYGWWQSHLYNYIDADHVVLGTESEGENRARVLSAAITGTFITGDDFSKYGPWSVQAKRLFQIPELLKVVKDGRAFRPLYGNTGQGTSEMFYKIQDGHCYLACFNFRNLKKELTIDFKRLGLKSATEYEASEIFSGLNFRLSHGGKVQLAAEDAVFLKFKI